MSILDILHKLTHLVAVCQNRGDIRLVDFLLKGVDTLFLVHGNITFREETVSEINQFLL